MSQKGNRGKPTRKQIDNSIQNIIHTIQLIGQKIDYLEKYSHSTEMALDLYTQMKGDKEEFLKYIEKFNKEEKKVVKEEKKS